VNKIVINDTQENRMRRILVIGGGFAGMSAAVVAADEIRSGGGVRVTVVSDSDQITIRPRLYEKNPESLRAPLRPVFDAAGVEFVEGTVSAIDTGAKSVYLKDGKSLSYDRLILATGSVMPPLPVAGVAEYSFNIDSFAGAVALDRHLRKVAKTPGAPGHGSYVIVGGGMTGIELAAELRNRIAAHSDAQTAAAARVILVEMASVIGPEFGEYARPVINFALDEARVERRLSCPVAGFDATGVTLADGSRIDAATVVVTVGLRASDLTLQIPGRRDALGRLEVDDDLKVVGLDDVYATGDVARARVDDVGNVALMSCQHARTMGKYAGLNAAHDLLGIARRPYRQPNYITCLDLGNFGAVLTMGWDRQVQTTGAEAKKRKIMINTELIYPPVGSADDIFAAIRIDERGR
jgi:NADH:ubiquinone reductase (H+-translocating)